MQSARIATAAWIDWAPNTPPPATIVYRTSEQLRSVACVNEQTVGYFDGRLHVSADPELPELVIEQTVVHEYLHFALNQLGVAKPMWLHEGLWTDWRGNGTVEPTIAMEHARAGMSDYKKIRVSPAFSRLRPSDTLKWHARARAWLAVQLEQPHKGPTVVVTHHAPTLRGCKPEDASTPFLGAYASELEFLMGPKVDAWVFGQTHLAFDERINGTRVVSNPRGYVGELVDGFRPNFTLEVPREPPNSGAEPQGGS